MLSRDPGKLGALKTSPPNEIEIKKCTETHLFGVEECSDVDGPNVVSRMTRWSGVVATNLLTVMDFPHVSRPKSVTSGEVVYYFGTRGNALKLKSASTLVSVRG